MQRAENATPIIATAGLLLETSVGSLTIDILGADCPALSSNFLNLCRAGLWHGAVATEVIPEVAIFFSLSADPTYDDLLRKALEHRRTSASAQHSVCSFWSLLPAQVATGTDSDPTSASAVRHALTDAALASASSSDVIDQQARALQQAMEHDIRQCKRRRCVGLSLPDARERSSGNCGSGEYRPVFAPASAGGVPSPCTVCRAGSLLVDVTAPTLRFGLTLSNRTMDFLDRQYVTIGLVREGEAVLRRMQRAPVRDRSADTTVAASRAAQHEDTVAGRPASAWPQPVRMLRVKRAVVLPTAGTEKYVATAPPARSGLFALGDVGSAADAQRQRQRVGLALHQAGCFTWWASAAAVRAAHHQLVELVQACMKAKGYAGFPRRPNTVAEATMLMHGASAPLAAQECSSLQPFIVLRDAPSAPLDSLTTSKPTSMADTPELTYNAHYTGAFLSSEDEDDVYEASGGPLGGTGPSSAHALSYSAKQIEERRKLFMQQHQEKANETLSLMLNVLNGVADIRGDLKPPENVLFVCKLNPVTTGEGLALCFAQFGRVVSAEVVQDTKTKQSLCYGFVEFESVEACFRAFQKMDRALIDDCRIHVDFSQSVSKLWAQRQREMRKRDRPS